MACQVWRPAATMLVAYFSSHHANCALFFPFHGVGLVTFFDSKALIALLRTWSDSSSDGPDGICSARLSTSSPICSLRKVVDVLCTASRSGPKPPLNMWDDLMERQEDEGLRRSMFFLRPNMSANVCHQSLPWEAALAWVNDVHTEKGQRRQSQEKDQLKCTQGLQVITTFV